MVRSRLSLHKHIRRLHDPRLNRRKRHLLSDILTIAVCAVLAGANTWPDIETFGRKRRPWLQRFLELPNGIPSHDTFERVFDRLQPQALQAALLSWLHEISAVLGVRHIAIDGKTLCHSGGGSSPLRYLHLVSAWAVEANLTLGQVATNEKSNEIEAIPRLLELLDVQGALVSIDAMGCQKAIAAKIVAGGGDYILTVKDNQEHLREDVEACFIHAYDNDFHGVRYETYETVEKGHGREEKRVYELIHEPEGIGGQQEWEKLSVIGKCYSERTIAGQTTSEMRYFIGSRRCGVKTYGTALRNHWRMENCLHWQLDVTFAEDASRIQKRQGAENFALLRRLALALLKRHPGKGSMRTKRYEATLDVAFLEEILKQESQCREN
jgi:predicted transposase YbfD/YdcC